MTPYNTTKLVVPALIGLLMLPLGIHAQDPPSDGIKSQNAASPSAEQVLENMIKQRGTVPPIKPSVTNKVLLEAGPAGAPLYAGQPTVDPRIVGMAPDMPQPKLRREGEFIPLRRGRIVRSPNASQMMFVFDADSPQAPEVPMFIMPCKILESMENIIAQQGDKVVFRLAGQVFTYRGANYLLPTVMKQASNRGNLKN